jgi:hypothetical protein
MKLEEAEEMSYPRKYVEHSFIGLEDSLNQHLIKLAGFDFPLSSVSTSGRRSGVGSITATAAHEAEPPDGVVQILLRPVVDYPFGGVEVRNMRTLMQLISEQYPGVQPTKSAEELVAWLQEFHTRLAEALHNGERVLDLVGRCHKECG